MWSVQSAHLFLFVDQFRYVFVFDNQICFCFCFCFRQWGDPTYKCRDFNFHLNKKHQFDYAEFSDFDGGEEEVMRQAMEMSMRDARPATATAGAPPPNGSKGRTDAQAAGMSDDDIIRLVIERSLRDPH